MQLSMKRRNGGAVERELEERQHTGCGRHPRPAGGAAQPPRRAKPRNPRHFDGIGGKLEAGESVCQMFLVIFY